MRDHLPLALRLYRLASIAAAPPLASRLLAWRLKRGKEHPARLAERYGEASLPRPTGPLIWLHGASVGEMLAVIPLIERIRAQNFAVLVTSGTVTSAALAEQRLPAGAFHQFIPLDAPRFVGRFLDHWRPDLALFVESDLWPNLILACADRAVPMILVNGRVSERSFSRWRLLPGAIAALLERFDLCLAQSSADAERYAQLGAPRISSIGNLKLDVPAPPVDQSTLRELKSIIGARVVIAAASTHAGEETAIIAAHRRLRAKCPSLLTVIAPRHPERGPGIAELAKVAGLAVALRSRGDLPKPDVDVFIADTLGELGLIYRLAPIVFMGGSLASHGGQNPIEAIRLGAAVVHGPHVWNFAEIYATLDEAHGAELIPDAEALTARLTGWLAKPAARTAVADAAILTVGKLGGALERTLAAVEPYLMQLRLEQRVS
ncbi:MAG: 3-deoxy-D-manno-octulosonic acid transferase [Xanthobacteraceae bacterium]